MRQTARILACYTAMAAIVSLSLPARTARASDVAEQEIVPIVLLRCTVCHGLRNQEAGLDLRSRAGMLRGGKSGPAIVPGKPDESLLIQKITSGEMPPRRRLVETSIKVIEPHEVALLRKWIEQGAPENQAAAHAATAFGISDSDRAFWAFQPASRPEIPDTAQAVHPIDAFVFEKLAARNLEMAPEADRRTLLRRVFLDLLGLPPTPEETRAFLNDHEPDAYQRLIDRLLASPRYGERWARYWLDLAGYADSEGVQHADALRQHAWRYRDYVIRSFNADKRYDQFLLEQIAGDEIADYRQAPITPELHDSIVATGFLRMAPDGTGANTTNFVPDRLEVIGDAITTLSSAVLGLTFQCARCHDHKLEPIPQEDYFRLVAIFKGAYDEHDWLKPNLEDKRGPFGPRLLPHVLPEERQRWEANEARIRGLIAEQQSAVAVREGQLCETHRQRRLAELPEVLRGDLSHMLATPKEQRTEVQKYLAEKFEDSLTFPRERLLALDPEFKKLADDAATRIKLLEAERSPEPMIRALWDRGEPSPTYLP